MSTNSLHPTVLTDAESAAHQAFLSQRYFASLDGLRALSVLAVIWHHCNTARYGGILATGFTGVYLFFAISGFLITTLLLRERDRNGEISLLAFYRRRTLRIFPLYYALVALYAVLILLVDRRSEGGQNYLHNLPYFLSYTTNWYIEVGSPTRIVFYHAWSLATEEQFYLLWPWVVRYARTFRGPVAFMLALLAADQIGERAVLRGLLSMDQLWVRVLTSIATPICMGCLFAYLLHLPAGFRLAYRVLGRSLSVPLVAGAVILGLLYDGKPYLFLNLAMAALVAAVCIRKDQPLLALLSCSPVRYVGTISYGMYLLHVLAMNVAERILKIHHPVYEFLITVPLTLGFAALSHLSFESWFLRQRSSPSALSRDGLRRAVQWCLRRQPQADAVLVKIYLGERRT